MSQSQHVEADLAREILLVLDELFCCVDVVVQPSVECWSVLLESSTRRSRQGWLKHVLDDVQAERDHGEQWRNLLLQSIRRASEGRLRSFLLAADAQRRFSLGSDALRSSLLLMRDGRSLKIPTQAVPEDGAQSSLRATGDVVMPGTSDEPMHESGVPQEHVTMLGSVRARDALRQFVFLEDGAQSSLRATDDVVMPGTSDEPTHESGVSLEHDTISGSVGARDALRQFMLSSPTTLRTLQTVQKDPVATIDSSSCEVVLSSQQSAQFPSAVGEGVSKSLLHVGPADLEDVGDESALRAMFQAWVEDSKDSVRSRLSSVPAGPHGAHQNSEKSEAGSLALENHPVDRGGTEDVGREHSLRVAFDSWVQCVHYGDEVANSESEGVVALESDVAVQSWDRSSGEDAAFSHVRVEGPLGATVDWCETTQHATDEENVLTHEEVEASEATDVEVEPPTSRDVMQAVFDAWAALSGNHRPQPFVDASRDGEVFSDPFGARHWDGQGFTVPSFWSVAGRECG